MPQNEVRTASYDEKRRFIVYFSAHKDFKLRQYVTTTFRHHKPSVVRSSDPSFVTIEIRVSPSELRAAIRSMPRSIIVSYEAP